MKLMIGPVIVGLVAFLLISGCDQLPGAGSDTLLVDLGAVAQATGQEESMQVRAQEAREEINAQLVEVGRNLEQKIQEERARIGDAPTQEQEQELQQLALQAQQQYSQLQGEAQQQVQQFEVNLVREFRETVMPFAEKIARSRGGRIVLLADQMVFWMDPKIDITGEVITIVRAEAVFAESDSGQVPEAPAIIDP